MKKSTLQVRLNRRVAFDRRIEVPSPSFFLNKNEEKQSFADWLIELANRGFGMSTDAFLKSVKKFLDKEVRIILLTAARVPHHTPVICYVLFHDDKLYIPGIDCQTTLQVQEKLISRLPVEICCTITLLLLCPDTGPAVRILGNIGTLQKY